MSRTIYDADEIINELREPGPVRVPVNAGDGAGVMVLANKADLIEKLNRTIAGSGTDCGYVLHIGPSNDRALLTTRESEG